VSGSIEGIFDVGELGIAVVPYVGEDGEKYIFSSIVGGPP
jgi:hypothetical protein